MFDVRLFFCVSAANEAASDFVGCCFLLSARNEEVIVFESQASVSPQRKKLAHQHRSRAVYSILTTTLTASLCLSASAATVWEKANEIMKDVYKQILGISTIAAIVTAAVALLMMNFSRSGRTVDESRAWLKRIIITWAVLNGLGFIMSYVTPFFSGGQWTAP